MMREILEIQSQEQDGCRHNKIEKINQYIGYKN